MSQLQQMKICYEVNCLMKSVINHDGHPYKVKSLIDVLIVSV